jgi:hypothetical protein
MKDLDLKNNFDRFRKDLIRLIIVVSIIQTTLIIVVLLKISHLIYST